jgi:hypothetical protein
MLSTPYLFVRATPPSGITNHRNLLASLTSTAAFFRLFLGFGLAFVLDELIC